MTTFDEGVRDYLAISVAVTQTSDWKEALDSVMAVVRSVFLFDNLALYLAGGHSSTLTDIVYAPVGRKETAAIKLRCFMRGRWGVVYQQGPRQPGAWILPHRPCLLAK